MLREPAARATPDVQTGRDVLPEPNQQGELCLRQRHLFYLAPTPQNGGKGWGPGRRRARGRGQCHARRDSRLRQNPFSPALHKQTRRNSVRLGGNLQPGSTERKECSAASAGPHAAAPAATRSLPLTFQAIHEQPLQALVNADLYGAVGRLPQQRRGDPARGAEETAEPPARGPPAGPAQPLPPGQSPASRPSRGAALRGSSPPPTPGRKLSTPEEKAERGPSKCL